MKSKNRREFIKCCSLMLGAGCFSGFTGLEAVKLSSSEKIDIDALTYCAYKCSPKECILLKATLENNEELRKKAYKEYKFKEEDGLDYDPAQVFCHTCKDHDKPVNVQVKRCDVRNCAVEKGLRGCIECKELAACDRDIWRRFPKQKQYALKLQKHWVEVEKQKLI